MNYLENTNNLFKYYKQLGDQSMAQLTEEQIFWKNASDENSIATIVKHLSGNMLSRWTNFRTEDGEKTWRNRDDEFEDATLKNKQQVLDKWQIGWACLFDAIEPLKEPDLEQIVYIRNQGHTVLEAMNRQLGHYAYHVGQLVLMAKMQKGKDWQTLSIAKGESKNYNRAKFAKEKERGHFTEEILKKK
ncbi:DUF1572 domain-containing protein [Aureispira anguillae]|uniref:DUF1572 domain-containing protein n=1 Tax=Aureispira anguillae TaxID=2864201 RepID=A0A915YDE9_9BACT|nr:DUF1572 domain-containing protein [Aureispira anguillae]BDS11057.1 DUF1572 domain-containing protein [Aureispira anguillae]